MGEFVTYRVYADGEVVHQDEFEAFDNAFPDYDDYGTYSIPVVLEDHLSNLGYFSGV
jgi:hypothetical protein